MSEGKTNVPLGYEKIRMDIFALVPHFTPPKPGWQFVLGKKPCFRIMDMLWFNERLSQANLAITACGKYIRPMRKTLATRAAWKKQGFDLTKEEFSLRQLVNAASDKRTPLSLRKALMGITLCEAILADLHKHDPNQPPGRELYDHMYIEPAVSHIPGLETAVVVELLKRKDVVERLEYYTGHTHAHGQLEVVRDMANGCVVTDRLAWHVYDALKVFVPTIMPPQIKDLQPKYSHSTHEQVDVDESKLPKPGGSGHGVNPSDCP